MPFLGFSDRVVAWYKCYLSNRKFQVNIENSYSEKADITCGVPQGSILGPLLFLLYVNDMHQAVDCELLLYADDSVLIFQNKDIQIIEDKLNKNFSNICDWFVDNRLSIHFGEDKTKSILFAPKHKLNSIRKLKITYGNIAIKQYSSVKYLGCILDETLSGNLMALNVMSKINKRLRFLFRKNKFLSLQLRRLLCNALIQPHFDYACSVWYPNLNKKFKTKLQTLQNKCIRFCLQLNNRSHIGYKEFENINWLTVDDRFKQHICTYAHKFFADKSPIYMKDVFEQYREGRVSTRNSKMKLSQPLRRSRYGQSSISYLTPVLWNSLPNILKETANTNTFKHELKKYFLENFRKKENDIFSYLQ